MCGLKIFGVNLEHFGKLKSRWTQNFECDIPLSGVFQNLGLYGNSLGFLRVTSVKNAKSENCDLEHCIQAPTMKPTELWIVIGVSESSSFIMQFVHH